MAFNSYMEWKKEIDKIGFQDIILGVKDTITADTLYISISDSTKVGSDDFRWVIGYTYTVIASVQNVDSPLIAQLAEFLDDGLQLLGFSDSSHLYNYQGSVYLPVGSGGQAWE